MTIQQLRAANLAWAAALAWLICVQPAFAQKPAADPRRDKGFDFTQSAPEPPRQAKHLALCIGIDHYHCRGYAELHFAQADARQASSLKSPTATSPSPRR